MRKKQQRFEANEKNPLCIQEGKPFFKKAKGNWAHFFGNQGPIFLELGCGSGRYTVALAHQYPEKNFVGIDIKGARIFQGSMEAKEKGSKNLAFLRTRIEAIEDFFAPNEVAGLYITFPYPRPKKRDQKRRLTSPHFLRRYEKIIHPQAPIFFKSDAMDLYHYTLGTLLEAGHQIHRASKDLHHDFPHTFAAKNPTTYEEVFLKAGKCIAYIEAIARNEREKMPNDKE